VPEIMEADVRHDADRPHQVAVLRATARFGVVVDLDQAAPLEAALVLV